MKYKTGNSLLLDENSDLAPYNDVSDYYLNICKARTLGFSFTPLKSWIYELINYYIAQTKS
ncbi:MAG: hypothetical protein RR621_08905 [Lachnospiraceae bacterium]